jgi:hypothetical protein
MLRHQTQPEEQSTQKANCPPVPVPVGPGLLFRFRNQLQALKCICKKLTEKNLYRNMTVLTLFQKSLRAVLPSQSQIRIRSKMVRSALCTVLVVSAAAFTGSVIIGQHSHSPHCFGSARSYYFSVLRSG